MRSRDRKARRVIKVVGAVTGSALILVGLGAAIVFALAFLDEQGTWVLLIPFFGGLCVAWQGIVIINDLRRSW